MSYCIFNINGGIGKTIAATAVCEGIKREHPERKLVVVSGYPDVFVNNPHVYRSLGFGQTQYFYEEFIDGKDVKIFAHDPYLDNSFLHGKSLIESWFKMFGVEYKGEKPKLYLTEREVNFHKQKFASDKPIFLMQTNGGAENQPLKYSWARDIPSNVVLKVIEQFRDSYNIVHIRRQDQIAYPDVATVTDDFRSIVTLISLSEKRLFMDSFAQHTAAALNKPSTVLWIANKPEQFGYSLHKNIVCNEFTCKPELKGSYFEKFNIQGDPLQFPFNSEDEIFDVDKILQSLREV